MKVTSTLAGIALLLLCVALLTAAAAAPPQRTRIGDTPTIPNGVMTPPQVVRSTPVLYTVEAFDNGIEGTVTVEAAVDIRGNVKLLRILKGLGHGLDQHAMEALAEWTFAPALRNGAPVNAIAQIDVDFILANATFRVGGGVTPPKVVKRVEPRYTEEARKIHYNGTVKLQGVIQKDGSINLVRVIQGLDHGLTDSAAEALRQWKFSPGTKGDGKPVPVSVNIDINFRLK